MLIQALHFTTQSLFVNTFAGVRHFHDFVEGYVIEMIYSDGGLGTLKAKRV